MENTLGVLIPILVPLGFFAMIFGIVYLRNQEKMAMIERGMDPRLNIPSPVSHNYVLTTALLLIGSGLGLFIAYILDTQAFPEGRDPTAIYFASIAFFGGVGLFIAYLIEKNAAKKQEDE
ncbi:MAG: DUF6249 domain-containing protein [Mucilaginibacter sp.]